MVITMDLSTLLMPGAQKLATAMLSDAWTATRDAIARHWGRGDRAETAKAVAELDASREQALAAFDSPHPDERLLQAFLAGYLAALTGSDPERLQVLQSLNVTPASGSTFTVHDAKIENLVQAGRDITGKVKF